ncbi:MAG: alpha/beta fold hydrolase [Candidatus Afipia apatlaquensis]|uniref:Alpha/beta fold hydrolase n=1 Tax=Candidatus Afipia apatlaquensis TaxID=2712852 RepID=A0A7C9RIK8_9BRAD|nr:alpha/beta fold hydrolase [Candidatus Afipia apatlaquensis]
MLNSLPIVLVPGLACSPRIYEPQIPSLWRQGAVLVANHARGGDMAAIARRILAEAPLRFSLAGHSMGGYIVFEMFRQAPERISRLAFLNTSARPEMPELTEKRRVMINEVKQGGYRAVMDRLFANFVHPALARDEHLHRIVLDMADDVGPDAFVWQLEAISGRIDSRPTLAKIKCPTLVLTSDTDSMMPPDASSEIANGIPGAKLVTIQDCGHLTQLEKPQAVTDALLDWLEM